MWGDIYRHFRHKRLSSFPFLDFSFTLSYLFEIMKNPERQSHESVRWNNPISFSRYSTICKGSRQNDNGIAEDFRLWRLVFEWSVEYQMKNTIARKYCRTPRRKSRDGFRQENWRYTRMPDRRCLFIDWLSLHGLHSRPACPECTMWDVLCLLLPLGPARSSLDHTHRRYARRQNFSSSSSRVNDDGLVCVVNGRDVTWRVVLAYW